MPKYIPCVIDAVLLALEQGTNAYWTIHLGVWIILILFIGMTDLLNLEKKLNSDECTKLIKFITSCIHPTENFLLKCQIIEFLVVKSEVPGSGVASTLSCDLSSFSWGNLFQETGLSLVTVQAIVSLKGIISSEDIHSIVQYVSNEDILVFATKKCTPKLNDSDYIKIYELALKLNMLKVVEELVDQLSTRDSTKLVQKCKTWDLIEDVVTKGVIINPATIVNKMSKADIQARTSLISYIKSTPEGCKELFLKAVEYSEFQWAEDIAKAPHTASKISISHLIKFPSQANTKEKEQRILLFKKLLDFRYDPNGLEGEPCPLDVVLELPEEYWNEKLKLLMVLLQHGAAIEHCTYERKNGATLIHLATKFAIDSERKGTMSCKYSF